MEGEMKETYGTQIGRVKWFNSRLGYGFITVGEEDIFVHQTNVKPTLSQFRTLQQGEYVSLNVSTADGSSMAIDVTGVHGGPLMCDSKLSLDEESGEVRTVRRRRPASRPNQHNHN